LKIGHKFNVLRGISSDGPEALRLGLLSRCKSKDIAVRIVSIERAAFAVHERVVIRRGADVVAILEKLTYAGAVEGSVRVRTPRAHISEVDPAIWPRVRQVVLQNQFVRCLGAGGELGPFLFVARTKDPMAKQLIKEV